MACSPSFAASWECAPPVRRYRYHSRTRQLCTCSPDGRSSVWAGECLSGCACLNIAAGTARLPALVVAPRRAWNVAASIGGVGAYLIPPASAPLPLQAMHYPQLVPTTCVSAGMIAISAVVGDWLGGSAPLQPCQHVLDELPYPLVMRVSRGVECGSHAAAPAILTIRRGLQRPPVPVCDSDDGDG